MNDRRRLDLGNVVRTALIVLFLAGLHLIAFPARVADAATPRYVNPSSGADAGACTNNANPCKTITYALSQSISGDTINAAAGIYAVASNGETFPLNINMSLTINGAGAGSTILDGANTSQLFILGAVTASISNMTVENGNNGSSYCGGGLKMEIPGATVTLSHLIFDMNVTSFGAGGAICQRAGNLTVNDSAFTYNSADSAGAIWHDGGENLTVNNSSFIGNAISGNGGGAIAKGFGSMNISNSTFTNNSASSGNGAAVSINTGGIVNISNSTFTGNTVGSNGGAFYVQAPFLGVPTVTVSNSTFSGNRAQSGAGIYNGGGNVTLWNTVMANSSLGGNCAGTITNGGNNVDDGTTCGWGSSSNSMSNVNPQLGPLTDNGGPTPTMALLSGSPAIDVGNNAICLAAPVNNIDQRGVTRITASDPTCDIGAYEAAPATPTELLASLSSTVNGLSQLSNGEKRSLTSKLDAAKAALGRKTPNAACGQVGEFVNEVNALVKSGRLTSAMGNQLIASAQSFRTLLGCR